MEPDTRRVALDDADLNVAVWGGGAPQVVLLHDGLGSVGQWRGLPARLAQLTGLTVAAYDRPGHGASTPVPAGAWPADWLHGEAERLDELLRALGTNEPVLIGHSDGGSIALIHAATEGATPLSGVVTLAAHSWVEQAAVDEISRMRANRERIVDALSRSHDAPAEVFEAWSGVWTTTLASWDIRPLIAAIQVPTLVLQGDRDEYATQAHAEVTAHAIGSNAEHRLLDDFGHLLHHQDEAAIATLLAEAVGSMLRSD